MTHAHCCNARSTVWVVLLQLCVVFADFLPCVLFLLFCIAYLLGPFKFTHTLLFLHFRNAVQQHLKIHKQPTNMAGWLASWHLVWRFGIVVALAAGYCGYYYIFFFFFFSLSVCEFLCVCKQVESPKRCSQSCCANERQIVNTVACVVCCSLFSAFPRHSVLPFLHRFILRHNCIFVPFNLLHLLHENFLEKNYKRACNTHLHCLQHV